jgi:hypothetical protein
MFGLRQTSQRDRNPIRVSVPRFWHSCCEMHPSSDGYYGSFEIRNLRCWIA